MCDLGKNTELEERANGSAGVHTSVFIRVSDMKEVCVSQSNKCSIEFKQAVCALRTVYTPIHTRSSANMRNSAR